MKHKATDAKLILGTELFNDRRSFLYECPKCKKQWRYAEPESNEYIFCNGKDFGLAEMDGPLTDQRYLENEYDLLNRDILDIFDTFANSEDIKTYTWIYEVEYISDIYRKVNHFEEKYNNDQNVNDYTTYYKLKHKLNAYKYFEAFEIQVGDEDYVKECIYLANYIGNIKLTKLGKLLFNKIKGK